MAVAQTKPKHAFFEGRIVPFEDAKVSVMTHALNYGTGVFGGLRAYWNEAENDLFIFRPFDHFERFLQSSRLLRMNLPYSEADLTQILIDLLRTEDYHENVYVRPLAYKSNEMIGVRLHDVDDAFTMFAVPFGRYVDKEEGLHVGFSAWRRIDDNAIPARGKIAGSYVNSALIKSDALLAGYDEALVLNQAGHVTESSAANIFVVRKGVVYTPPVSSDVLEGVVWRSLTQLMRDEMGLEVVQRDIDRTEIYIADEAFMCGTGVQIAAITRVEHRDIGSGQMGEITTALRELFFSVVRGNVPKYRAWLSPVYQTERVTG
ncbi:MAG: branched-chain amino acid transaminase [Chloroflexota bacterium]|nr:branched-chain amino acid transaminase [Chloroflexota bacterium]